MSNNSESSNTNTGKTKISLFDIIIIILSIYVLASLGITMVFDLPPEMNKLLDNIDNLICIFFLVDFVIEFRDAPDKKKFMKWGWIDIISCIPTINLLMYGRLFRLIRLLRILRMFRSTKIIVRYIFKSRIKGTMMSVVLITVLMVLFASISILMVENVHDGNIKTASDALWWTAETITTVGYGDLYPVTDGGRIIGTILMVTGAGIFGTYTAYIASWFARENEKAKERARKEMMQEEEDDE